MLAAHDAFAFLLLSLQILVVALLHWVAAPSVFATILTIALVGYLFVWLYKGMRSVYHQGRALTLSKYFLLLFAYAISLALTALGALTYTALTV